MSSHRALYSWNPRHVLEIKNNGRCVGDCCFPIAKDRLTEAEQDMVIMGTEEPNSVALRQELSALAEKLVCKRWHRDERERAALMSHIVRLWGSRVDVSAATETEKRCEMREKALQLQKDADIVDVMKGLFVSQNTRASFPGSDDSPPTYVSSAPISSPGPKLSSCDVFIVQFTQSFFDT